MIYELSLHIKELNLLIFQRFCLITFCVRVCYKRYQNIIENFDFTTLNSTNADHYCSNSEDSQPTKAQKIGLALLYLKFLFLLLYLLELNFVNSETFCAQNLLKGCNTVSPTMKFHLNYCLCKNERGPCQHVPIPHCHKYRVHPLFVELVARFASLSKTFIHFLRLVEEHVKNGFLLLL
ncbi:hypothetical protein M0813_05055 [Anaeramoeba flamelloides]|uniref:Uncharacterized protein n=1 Tax=Anaeramoeba flamelloides TaxID=1746091 RepID=A0ABQ8XHL9_9EUKA|nr:hypothetical protein M0813_05055 [Anaeramoeba flamelloides]